MTPLPNDPKTPQQRERSISPPPAAPATQTPGVRASTLSDVFHGALASTLKTCSYSNFSACFPTPARYVPESLDGLHRDFVGRLNEFCKSEFQTLLEDRSVVSSLNELDALIEEAKKRKHAAEADFNSAPAPIPPHMLQPSYLLSAHLSSFVSTQSEEYQHRIALTQEANKTLDVEISTQRADIESLIDSLEAAVSDLETASSAMRSEHVIRVEEDLRIATMPAV